MADVERSIRQVLDSIEKDKKIPKENKSALENHINFLRARGADPKTVLKHLYCMKKFLPALGGVDCREADRQDIERAMAKIEALSIGSETKRNVKSIIKAFYKHMLGEDLYYPKQVAWIKTSQAKNKRTLPEGILTEDDVLKMLTASGNVRDKAIVALLFDSGIRVGELLGVRVKDVDLDSEPAHVTVNGKTGMRRIPILFSVPYLAGYLNTIRDRKQPEPLFMAIGSWSNLERPVERAAVAKVLKLAAKRSHIDKPINPHAFRHARATYYASRLTEQQLKAFFGWTGDSRMASTYVHLSGRDID
ncbi:MAG: tyrosine-type recombinase/integrase, partial [Candidatus Micrarchaeota archaeon]|nr:tyrosine-type recombinase/integrase [Candidatus Micrarchaeota archaeon]